MPREYDELAMKIANTLASDEKVIGLTAEELADKCDDFVKQVKNDALYSRIINSSNET